MSPKTRDLLAVGLGCDVYKSGIRGVSKVVVNEWLVQHKDMFDKPDEPHKNLLTFFGDRYSCDNIRTKKMVHTTVMSPEERAYFEQSISTLVDAFIFEPCNLAATSDNTEISEPIYIHNNKPNSLHIYLEDFAKAHALIASHGEATDLSTCDGIGKGSHVFLTFEGTVSCFECNCVCCQYCHFEMIDIRDNINHKFCGKCFLSRKLIPNVEIEKHVPLEEMILELQKVSIEVNQDNNVDIIITLYHTHVTNKDVIFSEDVLSSCSQPYENSDYLNHQHVKFHFNFKEGGRIIRHNNLDTMDKLSLLSLFAKLVTVKPDPKNRHHNVIPQSGYRR